MNSHRIEITFSGPAPADELARAKILGNVKVAEAIEQLLQTLKEAGLDAIATAQSIRSAVKRPRMVSPRNAAE